MHKFIYAIFVLVLAACNHGSSSGPGTEYLGKWIKADNADTTLEISRNGEGFLISATEPGRFGAGPQTTTMPATYKDGVLQVVGGLGSGFTYLKDKDMILSPFGRQSDLFKRVK
jgi:hypothetical protein